MSTVKRMLVLANSVKHAPGRCIAGRELTLQPNGPSKLDGWIRPVSLDGNEGTLYPAHYRIQGGGLVSMLELYDVPLLRNAADLTQPENWIVDTSKPWVRIGVWPAARVRETLETPDGLWVEPGGRSDRISTEHMAMHPPGQSICVIQLADAAIRPDAWDERRHRLHFEYLGVHYGLKITDPLLPQHADGTTKPTAACISLAPPYQGHHYKLVASLFWADA